MVLLKTLKLGLGSLHCLTAKTEDKLRIYNFDEVNELKLLGDLMKTTSQGEELKLLLAVKH